MFSYNNFCLIPQQRNSTLTIICFHTFYHLSCLIHFIINSIGYILLFILLDSFYHLSCWILLTFIILIHFINHVCYIISFTRLDTFLNLSYQIHFMIYNVGYFSSFDCMIIIHTILHINSPLHISLYTFHYIDTGIIHTTIKHFETIFHKLSMLYCSSWHFVPSKSTFHSLNWIRQILQYMYFNTDVGLL